MWSNYIDDLLKKCINKILSKEYSKCEEYLNLISLYNGISVQQKAIFYSYKFSSIYHQSEDEEQLFKISRKLIKLLKNNEDDNLIPRDIKKMIVKQIYKFTTFLHKSKNYFFEYYLEQELKKFRKYYPNDKMSMELSYKIKNSYEEINKMIIEQQENFKNKKYRKEYKNLKKLFIENKYNLKIEKRKPKDSCFILSTYWVRNFIYYLNKITNEIQRNNEEVEESEIDIEISQKLFQFRKTMYLYFHEEISNEDYLKYASYPGPINNLSIISNCNHWVDPDPKEKYTNQYLANKSIENDDFQIIDQDTYSIIKKIFGVNYELERKIIENSDKEIDIEVYLLKFKILILSHELLLNNLKNLITVKKIQISKTETIEDLKNKIIRCLNIECKTYINKYIFDNKSSKFHFILPELKSEKSKDEIYNIINCYYNNYSTYIEKISGIEIKDNSKEKLDNLKISEDDILIVEIEYIPNKEKEGFQWFINIKTEDDYLKCSLCQKPIYNKFQCDDCTAYIYCSKKCKDSDKKHKKHHETLDKLYKKKFALHDMLAVDIKTIITPNGNHGLTGLKNLGNTCFMNSALQCLSSCEELTKYFLLKKYKEEINKKNKNGSGGQIAKAYYSLISELWNGKNSYINPWDFRQIFVSFVKQFAGFSQQDSDEMLTFMIDNLHEDLNRVKSKPYSELNERNENETEEEASIRWWKNHVDRENSIIVDLFHGQFKSVVKCPQCKRVNTIYDPFMHLGLPIPTPQSKIRVKYINEDNLCDVNVNIFYFNCNENTTVREIKNKILDEMEKIHKGKVVKNKIFTVEGILVDQNKNFKTILDDENDQIMPYYLNNLEAIFYKVESRNEPNLEYFKIFVTPVLMENDKQNNNIQINNLFYPKIFNFEITLSVREIYFHLFVYYRKLFKDLENRTLNKFQENQKAERIKDLNDEFTEYFEVKDSNPFKLYIINNVPKKAQFSCEYCNRSCKYCLFPFKFTQNVKIIKNSQKVKRPFLLYLENLFNSEVKFVENDMNQKDFKKDLITKNKETSIYDCLEAFRTEEKLEKDNSWFCSTCKKHQEAYKKLEIFRAPNILIIQLKRFKIKSENIYSGVLHNKKNDSLVIFPISNLDLRQYVVEENSKKDSIYDLCAISLHFGSLSSGHYTAFCKNLGEWYNFDDEKVSKKNEGDLVTKAAYILIYRKKSLNQKS